MAYYLDRDRFVPFPWLLVLLLPLALGVDRADEDFLLVVATVGGGAESHLKWLAFMEEAGTAPLRPTSRLEGLG